MILLTPSARRRGYALTVVLITLILLFTLWSFVYRTTSSVVRIETNRLQKQTSDQGAMNALSQALQLLQYNTPSDPSNPESTAFTYYVTLNLPDTSSLASNTTTVHYSVVYTLVQATNPQQWQVQVTQVPEGSVNPATSLPSSIPAVWPPGAGQP